MKNPFNLKRDIDQLEETGKKIGKQMEGKMPITVATTKSIFVIIKWILILVAVIFLIGSIFDLVIYIIEIPERIEIQRQQEQYAMQETAFQNCLDKVTELGVLEEAPPLKDTFRLWTPLGQKNKYYNEWANADRPYPNGYWAIGFVKWMMENYSSFCEEFDPELINAFIDIKSQ